jgi:DNA polymerase I
MTERPGGEADSTPAVSRVNTPNTERLLLVDGHAYAYRAYHAIRGLTGPDGRSMGAVFGFIKMLGRLMKFVGPTHVAVVWDGGLDAVRLAALPAYKAQRPAMPEDLDRQIGDMVRFLQARRITSLQREGVEADDWLASLAVAAAARGWRAVLASSDKDFFQLISESIGLVNPGDEEERIWGRAEVAAKTGVNPEQVVDWLSLVGDAVDNIGGVDGVGGKTAAKLLAEFGSIEALYGRLESVKQERLRAALEAARETVQRNRSIIRLNTEMDCDGTLADLSLVDGDRSALKALYQAWGFRGLRAELESPQNIQSELL